MEIMLKDTGGGIPPYPYRKVVIVADRTEVAEVPCDGDGTENIVYHADLFALLAAKDPKLADASFTPGWLTQTGSEATLSVAGVISTTEAEQIGAAMTDWCEANGITTLVITDASRKSGTETANADDWDIFSTTEEP
jgi:hypothetical protein